MPALDQTPLRVCQILISDRPISATEPRAIPVILGGEDIVVGPIWGPGAACPDCVRIRRDVRRSQPELTAELAAWYRTEAEPLFQGISRSLVDEALSIARRAAALGIENRIWVFRFGTQLWHEEQVVPVWNCPTCGDSAPLGVGALVAELEGSS